MPDQTHVVEPTVPFSKGNRRMIVVGPDYSEAEVAASGNASPAAAAWMRNFIGILTRIARVDASYWFTVESAWPRGRISIPGEQIDGGERLRRLVGYKNVLGLKRVMVSRSLAKSIVRDVTANDDIIIYGQRTLAPKDMGHLARVARRLFLIVPDAAPGRRGEQEILLAARQATGGVIYLPAELGGILRNLPSISFQGVVHPVEDRDADLDVEVWPRRLVFVGGVDCFSGAHFLREALEMADLRGSTVVVIGRIGDKSEAEKLRTLGVEVTGFLDEDRMLTVCRQAFAFLNPRDPRMELSNRNFPSKLLLYLRFGRPVVSTDTLGLPRFVASALACEGTNSPEAFARQLESLLACDEQQLRLRSDRLRKLVVSKLSEDAVISELEDFLFK